MATALPRVGFVLVALLLIAALFFLPSTMPQAKPSDAYAVPCEEALSPGQCRANSSCHAIIGSPCGTDNELFYGCVPNSWCNGKLYVPPTNYTDQHPDLLGHTCATRRNSDTLVFFKDGCMPEGFDRQPCRTCCSKPKRERRPRLTVACLHYHNHGQKSLANSMRSWKENGLLDYADELLLLVNALPKADRGMYWRYTHEYGFKLLQEEENLGIGLGMQRLVEEATSELVLFMEKDFALVEGPVMVARQLDAAKRYVTATEGRIDVFRLRSRLQAGEPNCPKEKTIPPSTDLENPSKSYAYLFDNVTGEWKWWEPHLFCNLIHFWHTDYILDTYPTRVWRCGCDPEVLCFDSLYCGWTNNPSVFLRSWFFKYMTPITTSPCTNEDWIKSGFCKIKLEATSYYAPEWIDPHHVISHTDGLFMHYEIDE